MSYRCGSDLELEKIQIKLLKEANGRLFHNVPDMDGFGYTYLEERLYLVKNLRSGVMFFAEGKNPKDATEKVFFGAMEEKNDMDKHSIDELGLSVKARNVLARAGIRKIYDLRVLTRTEALKIRNMGEKTLEEIEKTMKEYGIEFSELKKVSE